MKKYELNGKTYIKVETKPSSLCTGCVFEVTERSEDTLCQYCDMDTMFKEENRMNTENLPLGVYRGFSVVIASEFISGADIEYSHNSGTTWLKIPEYNPQSKNDIYRVSNSNYLFRVKKKETVRYMYLNTSMGEEKDSGYNNAVVTFDNTNKPTKVTLK